MDGHRISAYHSKKRWNARIKPAMRDEVVAVTGLPRSGTSLVMQMLSAGGVPVLTDDARLPDIDNPRGYFEYEPVKRTFRDARWIAEAKGKGVKWLLRSSSLFLRACLVARFRSSATWTKSWIRRREC
jgi:hypothetical protein